MPRKSSKIEVREIFNNEIAESQIATRPARTMIAHDLANLIKSMISQGRLELKDGQILPRKTL